MEREKLPSTPLALQTYTPLSSVCASVIVSTPGRERGGGGGGGRCGSHLYGHKCITETAHHPYRHACTSHAYVQILCTKYGSNDSSPTEHSSACHTVTSILLSAVRQGSAPSPGPDKLHRVPSTLQGAGEGDRLARRGLQRVVNLPLSTIHHYHTWCGGINDTYTYK